MTVLWYCTSLCFRVSLSSGEMQGLRAASFQRVTTSSHMLAQAFWQAWLLELTLCFTWPACWNATLVLNHQTII